MYSEDLKKRFLNSRDLFMARRWEGKSLAFKLKFCYANYPECFLSGFLFLFVIPPILCYKFYTYPDSKKHAITKYKNNFTVVRDDHPLIEKIIEQKERGRHFFPQ